MGGGSQGVATKSITTYLPKDLAERLEVARQEGRIDVKDVVKTALARALDDGPPEEAEEFTDGVDLTEQLKTLTEVLSLPQVLPLWQGEEGSAIEVAGRIIERRAFPVIKAPPKPFETYQLVWSDDAQTLQARLDSFADTEAVPLSIASAPDGKWCLLVGWPPDV